MAHLEYYCDPQEHEHGVSIPIIKSYLSKLHSSQIKEVDAGIARLAKIAFDKRSHLIIFQFNGIKTIIALLSFDSHGVGINNNFNLDINIRFNACSVLGNLPLNDKLKIIITKEGGITQLIRLLEDERLHLNVMATYQDWQRMKRVEKE